MPVQLDGWKSRYTTYIGWAIARPQCAVPLPREARLRPSLCCGDCIKPWYVAPRPNHVSNLPITSCLTFTPFTSPGSRVQTLNSRSPDLSQSNPSRAAGPSTSGICTSYSSTHKAKFITDDSPIMKGARMRYGAEGSIAYIENQYSTE